MIQVSSRLVYENRWLSLREDEIRLPDGSPGIYTVVDKPTSALVIPMERGGCHLVEQYRYPISRRSWEFPQGTWGEGRSGSAEELARAELIEETGLRAGSMERIGRMAIAPGLTSQLCDIFLATDLTPGPSAREHTEQEMDQRWVAADELTAMVGGGQIVDALTLAAFSLLVRRAPEFGRAKPESWVMTPRILGRSREVTSGCGRTVPGTGTFFVGIDIIPGRYRCADGKGGWWVRFTGSGGERPVGMWPLPPGPAEVDIAADDFAFETRVPSQWELVSRAAPATATPRAVADPSLRGELDALVADRGHRLRVRLSPMSVLAVWFGAFFVLGSWWGAAFVPIALAGLLVGFLGDDMRRARALRRRRDRYLTPDDFDAAGRELLLRAQIAIDTVRDSEVNKEGLLDTVDNEVTLPGQEWEIAQVLARQSKLRRAQRELLELVEAGTVPEVEAAIKPMREKLEISVQSVTRRIEALERYAERARAADDAYRARRNLDALAERAHEYDDLVAGAVRDGLAEAVIDRLTSQGDDLVRVLRDRLGEAGGAAADLPPRPPAGDHQAGDHQAVDYPAAENS